MHAGVVAGMYDERCAVRDQAIGHLVRGPVAQRDVDYHDVRPAYRQSVGSYLAGHDGRHVEAGAAQHLLEVQCDERFVLEQ